MTAVGSKKPSPFLHNPFKNRSLVQRRRAGDYLLLTLLSFAFSVGATRLFLDLTGYPQLGNGTLHIAHVLWGGIFLFAASLLPIIYVNEWIVGLAGLLSGFGVGLFIDEVGKFITQTNDYFYPSAAPIIYVLFLLTVFVFTRVKVKRKPSTRVAFYAVLEQLTELLDRDLSHDEAADLQRSLKGIIARSDEPDLTRLAQSMLDYLTAMPEPRQPFAPSFLDRLKIALLKYEKTHLGRKRLRILILVGLVAWAAWSLISPVGYWLAIQDPGQLQQLVDQLITQRLITNQSGLTWFQARILLEGGTGVLAAVAALLLSLKKEKAGTWLGIGTMLLALTIVNLLIFYFDQFSTILLATYQFILFSMLLRYQKRFLRQAK